MQLHDVTDREWEMLIPMIVQERVCRRIAPSILRQTVDGILWRMRTGKPWCLTPQEYGNWGSIRRRFQSWSEAGLWRTITIELAGMRERHWETISTPPCPRALPAAVMRVQPPA